MGASADNVMDDVRRYIVDNILPGEDPASIADTTPLKESGILDSITTLELVGHLERNYHIEISPHEAASGFDSVADIGKLIAAKTEA